MNIDGKSGLINSNKIIRVYYESKYLNKNFLNKILITSTGLGVIMEEKI